MTAGTPVVLATTVVLADGLAYHRCTMLDRPGGTRCAGAVIAPYATLCERHRHPRTKDTTTMPTTTALPAGAPFTTPTGKCAQCGRPDDVCVGLLVCKPRTYPPTAELRRRLADIAGQLRGIDERDDITDAELAELRELEADCRRLEAELNTREQAGR